MNYSYLPAQWSDGDHVGRGHVWSCSPGTLAAVIDRNSSTLSPWDNLWSGETACARCSPLDVPFPLALENKILIIENEHVSTIGEIQLRYMKFKTKSHDFPLPALPGPRVNLAR